VPLEYLSAGSFNLTGLPPRAFGARLSHLSFGGGFACKGLRFLFPLPKLASLHVQGIGVVTDLLLRRVGLVQASLERLALRSGYGLSAGALDALAPLARLEALSLAACPGVPAERVAQFVADHPRLGRMFKGPCPLAPCHQGEGSSWGGGGGGGGGGGEALYAVPADDCGGGVCGTTVVRRTPEQRSAAAAAAAAAAQQKAWASRLREPLRPLREEEEAAAATHGEQRPASPLPAAVLAAAEEEMTAASAAAQAADAAAAAIRPPKPALHGYGGSFAALFDVAAPDPVAFWGWGSRAVGAAGAQVPPSALVSAGSWGGPARRIPPPYPLPPLSPVRRPPSPEHASAGDASAAAAAAAARYDDDAAAAAAAARRRGAAAAAASAAPPLLALPCARSSLASCASHGGCGMSWVTPGSTPIPLPPPRRKVEEEKEGCGGEREQRERQQQQQRARDDAAVAAAAAIMAAAALNVPM
jgi:hypothetical protein